MQALGHGHAAVAHGFKVGVGSLAAAALYERVLLRDFAQLDIDGLCRAWPSREQVEQTVRAGHDIPPLAENAVEETLAKYLTPDELRERLLLIQQLWPTLRERLREQLLSADELRRMLKAAGCPTEPNEIGLTLPQVRESYWLARTIRSRYTVLDLIYETGILDACVAELFAPDGYWGKDS
jgi:glycerol-1-phosphate dehydrogenase [NAD(P)+]